MEWAAFVLTVLFVAVLQVALWRRIQDGDVGAPDVPVRGETPASAEPPAQEPDDPDLTLCPSCGTENDATYEFCRECTTNLYA
jgi:hypothetical protein